MHKLSNLLRYFSVKFSHLIFILQTNPPLAVLVALLNKSLTVNYRSRYKKEIINFENIKHSLQLSNDWFSPNIPY